jgi:7-carboxy-7-deazaguanine synthase
MMRATTYGIAPDGIFWSLQGEAHLRGFQMAFVRLAGCSVGCPQCDTDYSLHERLTVDSIVARVREVTPASRDQWVWITGGEPADRNLLPLLTGLKRAGFSTAIATSGKHRVIPPCDWLSVSYHGGYPLLQKYGNEIKLVDGLNGMDFDDFLSQYPDEHTDFLYRYVQPLWRDGAEDASSLRRCLEWLRSHPNWSLSRQDHKHWTMP